MTISLISQKYPKNITGVLQLGRWYAGVYEAVEPILWSQPPSNVSAWSRGATRFSHSLAEEQCVNPMTAMPLHVKHKCYVLHSDYLHRVIQNLFACALYS